jgi:hypothetical protein
MTDSPSQPGSPPAPPAADDDDAAVAEIINHIAKLPNLDRLLFGEPDALEQTRGRMRRTAQSLERVARHGAGEDVERAKRAALAYQVVLAELDALLNFRAKGAK